MRFKLSRWLNANEPTGDATTPDIRILFSPSIEARDFQAETVPDLELEEAAELVDTTLFRAYMLCRPQLVGPLVRRPNRCIPNVVQEMLEQAHVSISFIYPLHPRSFRKQKLIVSRNIEILLNFYWGKDYIDKHYNYYNH